MTVTLKKVETGKYEVKVDRNSIGIAKVDWKGMYVIELPNRIEISAVSQGALKRMVANNINR